MTNAMRAGVGVRPAAVGRGVLRIGQNVMHAKFGLGVIVNAEGSGRDARAQVNFGGAGTRWLALAVARLEAVRVSLPLFVPTPD